MEGASVPDSVKDLARKKTIIAFVDGDRGGELILRELLQIADVDYVARAPQGKEVEDLTGKELAKCLRSKVPIEQYQISGEKRQESSRKREQEEPQVQAEVHPPPEKAQERVEEEEPAPAKEEVSLPGVDMPKLKSLIEQLQGSLEAALLDESWEQKQKVAVRELADTLQGSGEKIQAVVFDGVITQRLLDTSSSKGVSYLIGARIGNIAKRPQGITILTFEDIGSK
jgi:DNA primase